MRSILLATALVSLLAPAIRQATATVADDLCDPLDDPCVIAGSVTLDPGSLLTFGGRAVRLAPDAKVSFSGGLAIHAASCEFLRGSTLAEGTPSDELLILGCATSTLDGRISLQGATLLLSGAGPHVLSGQIKVAAAQAGTIGIDSVAAPGHVTISGKIDVKSKGSLPGEFRVLTNFGNIAVTEKARIKLRAATADPSSEFFFLEAPSGSVTVDGLIDVRAKLGAAALNVEGDQAVVFGPKSKVIARATGTGARIAINSQSASVTLRGKIQAPSKALTGGEGSRVRVCAGDDVLVAGRSSIDASTGDHHGSIIIGAFDRATVGEATAGARLLARTEGDIEVCGGTSGLIRSSSTVIPAPFAVGSGVCLSPTSGVLFSLDCAS